MNPGYNQKFDILSAYEDKLRKVLSKTEQLKKTTQNLANDMDGIDEEIQSSIDLVENQTTRLVQTL